MKKWLRRLWFRLGGKPKLQGPEELYCEVRIYRMPSGDPVLVWSHKLVRGGESVWTSHSLDGSLVGPGQRIERIVIRSD